jgi:hypothetical protein
MTDDDYQEAHLKLLMGIRQECIRTNRLVFDASRPVDEYLNVIDPQPAGDYEIQPDYAMPIRIGSIFASLPVGITKAVLQLGTERQIILYSGNATTVQTLVNLVGLGIIITDNDRRVLTLTGTSSTGFHIELAGHVLERYGSK